MPTATLRRGNGSFTGALLIGGHPSGLYWLVPGVLASFSAGIQNAWVLLIEILR